MKPIFHFDISLILGIVGTALGIINGLRQILSSRVKLRVITYPIATIQDDTNIQEFVVVEVVNLSSFPITLKEITFQPFAPKKNKFLAHTGRANGKHLPIQVASRDSVQIYYPKNVEILIKQSRKTIVETACGKIKYGNLKKFHHLLKSR